MRYTGADVVVGHEWGIDHGRPVILVVLYGKTMACLPFTSKHLLSAI
jgi:hypothetical protein